MPKSYVTQEGAQYCSIPIAARELKTSRIVLKKAIDAGRVPAYQDVVTGQYFMAMRVVADLKDGRLKRVTPEPPQEEVRGRYQPRQKNVEA